MWAAVAAGILTLAPGPRRRQQALVACAGLAAISTTALAYALVVGDFSLAYVAETTSRATPWPYRLAALWGGMEGSMLFYATLGLCISAAALRSSDTRFRWAPAVAGFVGVGYLLVAALAANPFTALDIPAVDGQGLLAILQHPAMVYHPPILYLGLTILVVPFAQTVEAIADGRLGAPWVRATRRWMMAAWTTLTIGMLAGSSWAYVELGWGGFWAWDAVENTALMPWVAITVFLHTSRIQERDGRLRRWNVAFALLPFALTILGVYLTRSGVTGSIHSFAENPVVGVTLLSAAVVALLAVVVTAVTAPSGESWAVIGLGRDTWLATAAGLLSATLLFITVGTAYPAYSSVFLGRAVTVDVGFFVTTVGPISVLIGVLTAFALRSSWRGPIALGPVRIWSGACFVAVIVIGSAWGFSWFPTVVAAVGGGGVVALLADLLGGNRRSAVPHLAHLGLALILLGAGGSALGDEYRGPMTTGDTVEVAGRVITLEETATGESDRYLYARAVFDVDGNDRLTPEIRAYEEQAQPISEPALRSRPTSDVVIAISRLAPDGETVSVSVFVKPLVWSVWAGALTMALAGLVGLFGRHAVFSGRRRTAREGQPPGDTTSDIAAH